MSFLSALALSSLCSALLQQLLGRLINLGHQWYSDDFGFWPSQPIAVPQVAERSGLPQMRGPSIKHTRLSNDV